MILVWGPEHSPSGSVWMGTSPLPGKLPQSSTSVSHSTCTARFKTRQNWSPSWVADPFLPARKVPVTGFFPPVLGVLCCFSYLVGVGGGSASAPAVLVGQGSGTVPATSLVAYLMLSPLPR